MAKKKTTAEERARFELNQERFWEILRKALRREGASEEEIERRVGPPRSSER
jgi:hypothetical protein